MAIDITFIVPVYNVEKYLRECIESILFQSNISKEIILVNDGSTDNSLNICNELKDKYSEIKVINKKNGGLSSARNVGIYHAMGRYVFFVDSDDFLIGDQVSELYQLCEENELDIIRAVYNRYYEKSNLFIEQTDKNLDYYNVVYSGKDFLLQEINNNSYEVIACLGLYRTTYLLNNKISFVEGVTHEDHEFTLKCLFAENNNRVMKVKNIIYGYREREGSITKTPHIKNIKDILININSMKEFIENLSLTKKDKSLAYKCISALFYQLTSIYGRLSDQDKKIALDLVPKSLQREMIKYSFNLYQKGKLIMFCYFNKTLIYIYKRKNGGQI